MTDSETPDDHERDECDDALDLDASLQKDDAESDQPARRIVVPGSGGKADVGTLVDKLGLLKFDASTFANFTSLYTPSIDFSRFADWGHAPALADLGRRIAEQTMAGAPLYSPAWFEPIVDALRESTKGWNFPDLADLVRPALPANIMEADIDYEPDEWMTWISEGLVIAWVPDAGTLELIAAADTHPRGAARLCRHVPTRSSSRASTSSLRSPRPTTSRSSSLCAARSRASARTSRISRRRTRQAP
ncbi:hypothetical protein BIU95_07085 [Curtobacterium sp. MCBA15_007]|uniref:hypothetical protein n=1 Tax=Curtobacterium sp. MCBA15_007 TaxID=1898735 RepID=UPI0008DCBB7A|nr:hypothetical protein [Curtobacterium sp. MCBA15_007]OII01442.1 hypothetical protein BIU95_07085 [Curtobacterium sp. MCBA15_007]